MPSIAEQIAEQREPQEAADPADADALGDETVARKRRRRPKEAKDAEPPEALGPPEKRLRLRPGVPVLSKYKGKKVSRREAFGDDDGDDGAAADAPKRGSDKEEDSAAESQEGEGLSSAAAGGFSIPQGLEAEYDRLMKQTSKDLEVMRKPTESEVSKRTDDAKALKRQLEAWNSLVEFRIHLEGPLSLGHRLPVGGISAAFREAESSASSEGDTVTQELRGLLGELQALQGRLLGPRPLREELLKAPATTKDLTAMPADQGEAAAWAMLDGRLEEVLGWCLETADDWKEKTRIDARRSFKVLDQSLRMQMQAVAEADAVKLRKRCTPPAGKHKVFGIVPSSSAAGEAQSSEPDTGEAGIFDDRDFYVQLLKEVLASGGSGKAGLGEDAKQLQAELQGRRATKKKARANVERRASKGRKIRFVPVVKLQNFMAPRPRLGGGAGDAAGDESRLLSAGGEQGRAPALLREGAVEALLRSMFAPVAS